MYLPNRNTYKQSYMHTETELEKTDQNVTAISGQGEYGKHLPVLDSSTMLSGRE